MRNLAKPVISPRSSGRVLPNQRRYFLIARCTVDCDIFNSLAISLCVIPRACISKARLSRSEGTSENLGQTAACGPTKASARSLQIGEASLHLDFLLLLGQDMERLLGKKGTGTKYSVCLLYTSDAADERS